MQSAHCLPEDAGNTLRVIGPYSKTKKSNCLLYKSGQIVIVLATGKTHAKNIRTEARQVLTNLTNVLAESDSSLENVVKITLYITNMQDFGAINDVYKEFFPLFAPLRVCVEVSCLPKGANIEIEAIALTSKQAKTPHD